MRDDDENPEPEEIPVYGGGVEWGWRLNANEIRNLTSEGMPALRAAGPQLKGNRINQEHFLRILAETGNIGTACLSVGCTRQSFSNLRKADETFAAAVEEALAAFEARVEGELVRRATTGVDKAIVSHGRVIGFQREFSDAMLLALLKKISPEWRAALASGTSVNVNASAVAGAKADAIAGGEDALKAKIRGLTSAKRQALAAALQALQGDDAPLALPDAQGEPSEPVASPPDASDAMLDPTEG